MEAGVILKNSCEGSCLLNMTKLSFLKFIFFLDVFESHVNKYVIFTTLFDITL